MWLVLSILSSFLLSVVNYTDEYLTKINSVPSSDGIHKQVGAVIIATTLVSFIGSFIVFCLIDSIDTNTKTLLYSLGSAIPLVCAFSGYFYLLLFYSIHKVLPLMQLTAVWLLIFEVLSGVTLTVLPLLGVVIIIFGTYMLDTGSLRWQIPTKLLLFSLPVSLCWAFGLFLVRVASNYSSGLQISMYQLFAIGTIGLCCLVGIKPYREGFLHRISFQGPKFVGLSLVNETFAQAAYVFLNIAITIAPMVSFVGVLRSFQDIFLVLLLFLFPIHARNTMSAIQVVAIAIILVGASLIQMN